MFRNLFKPFYRQLPTHCCVRAGGFIRISLAQFIYAVAVSSPIFQQAIASELTKVSGKLPDSSVVCREPICNENVDVRESSGISDFSNINVEGGSKLDASFRVAGNTLAPERKPMVGIDGDNAADRAYECDGYCGLYLSLSFYILTLLMAIGVFESRREESKLPDVLLSRAGH